MSVDQPSLPDPILAELDLSDAANNRCRGWVKTGRHRCRRKAPWWWPPGEPWWCKAHDSTHR